MAEANTPVTETNQNMAENSGGDPTQPVSPQGEKGVSTNEGAEKTFTQKELDDIVKQRLDRAKKDMPSKEELKAFKEWQDSQKTAEQLSAEKITAAENGRAEAEKRAAAAEAKCTAFSKGVKADSVDDAITLAMAMVSDSVTIEQAIDEVVKKYPSFCGAAQEAPKGITTGVSFNNSGKAVSGVEAAFLAKNPDLKL